MSADDASGPRDGLRAAAVLVTAVAQVVGSPVGSAVADRSVGEVSALTESLITPAGYAFSIWAVIFAGALAWAVWQLLPAQRTRVVHRRTGWPLAAAFAANTAWEVLFPLLGVSVPVLPVVVIGIVVAATALAWARLQAVPTTGLERVLPTAVTGLLLGWVSVAAAVNVASAGVALDAPATGELARVWAVFALVVVAILAGALVLWADTAAGPLALAAAWGLVAVAVDGGPTSVTVAALAAAGAVLLALAVRLATRPDRRTLLIG